MTTSRSLAAAERRRRIGHRHALAPGSVASADAAVDEAARAVVVLHATDPVSVYLAARARMGPSTPDDVGRALYETRSVVRMLGMRRTMFGVPRELVGIVQAAAGDAVAAKERRRIVATIESFGVAPDGDAWLRAVSAEVLAALEARGEAISTEISADVPALRTQVRLNVGKAYEGLVSISVWVLNLLSAEGRIVRARPRGTWISTQYRWTTTERWLGGPIEPVAPDVARARLVERWLERFGPGTIADLRWWTGWTLRDVRAALDRIATVTVDLDGEPGVVLAGDEASVADPGPWVALLPALDPTTMGWQGRDWYLGPHRPALFDTNGNAGPTIWADGRVVGGWAQRRDGEIAIRLLEDVGAEATAAIDAEADRLGRWLGPTRFAPRFRTPLERELIR